LQGHLRFVKYPASIREEELIRMLGESRESGDEGDQYG